MKKAKKKNTFKLKTPSGKLKINISKVKGKAAKNFIRGLFGG